MRAGINERVFATTADAARAQEEAATDPLEGLSPGERLVAEHTGVIPSQSPRRFSQVAPPVLNVEILLASINSVEALGTVLDLAFLVEDVSEEERDAREHLAAIVSSAARIIKSNLDQLNPES